MNQSMMTCAPSEDSDQPGHMLIWVFAGCTDNLVLTAGYSLYILTEYNQNIVDWVIKLSAEAY